MFRVLAGFCMLLQATGCSSIRREMYAFATTRNFRVDYTSFTSSRRLDQFREPKSAGRTPTPLQVLVQPSQLIPLQILSTSVAWDLSTMAEKSQSLIAEIS